MLCDNFHSVSEEMQKDLFWRQSLSEIYANHPFLIMCRRMFVGATKYFERRFSKLFTFYYPAGLRNSRRVLIELLIFNQNLHRSILIDTLAKGNDDQCGLVSETFFHQLKWVIHQDIFAQRRAPGVTLSVCLFVCIAFRFWWNTYFKTKSHGQ